MCLHKCNFYCILFKFLKQGVGSIVDWKPGLRNYEPHIKKKVQFVALLTTLSMFVVTQMIPQEILDLL